MDAPAEASRTPAREPRQRHPLQGHPRGTPGLLVLGIVALLAAAAFGLGGSSGVALTLDPLTASGASILPALLAADVAWLLAATLVVARASQSAALWPAFQRAALVNAALLMVAALVSSRLGSVSLDRLGAPNLGPFTAGGDPWTTELDIPGLRYVVLALGVVALVSAVGGAVLLVGMVLTNRGRGFRLRSTLRERLFGRGDRRSAEPEQVLDAIVRARRALAGDPGSDDEQRRAVVRAYAAMEHAVEARGGRRLASHTPAEFLRAALDGGLLRDREAAERLLRLFSLARFSHDDLPDGAAAAADGDLGRLQADLERAGVAR